jgi:hypothetical protein
LECVKYMKKGVVSQEEKIARNGVFSQDILTGTKRFRSGMRMTQDRISILTRRQHWGNPRTQKHLEP